MPNVRIQARGFHPEQSAPQTTTDGTGAFHLSGLLDGNAWLSVEAEGFYPEIVPLFLQGSEVLIELPTLGLVARAPGRVRLWIAGDTMFARRFEDRDEDGEGGEPEDLIQPDARGDDAFDLFRFILPALASADYRTANFESPASTAHDSRHPYKRFSFTSHPDTLSALTRAGIEAVSLGNNHSYDYLEAGRVETAEALIRHGIDFFGSGATESDARESFLNVTINDVPLSFQGFDGIKPGTFYPDPHQPWPPQFMYYAMDDPAKGGALLLSLENVTDFMQRSPERLRIPVMHGGMEYGELPTPVMRDRFEHAHQLGAKLVVAHHSHTVYGIALWGEPEDPSVSLLSLGNFIFDQDVFETMNSYMAVADVELGSQSGEYRLVHLRLVPFHQEAYVPSLISGRQAERLARHVGHISTFLPDREEDTLRPAVAFADAAGVGVMLRPDDYTTLDEQRTRTLRLTGGRSSPFSLNEGRGATDYFVGYGEVPAGARLRLARDVLIYGDFEDYDVDDEIGENSKWWQTDTRYPTSDRARSGRHSLALYRALGTRTPVNTQLRNRITFPPGAELSLGCYTLGVNAGDVSVRVEYIERDARDLIGEQVLMTWPAGSYDWTERHAALELPDAAGHFRFVITMQPIVTGGILYVDDCRIYSWGPVLAPGEPLPAPHGYDWAQLEIDGYEGDVSLVEERRSYRRRYGAL